jgi:hypothetical protein
MDNPIDKARERFYKRFFNYFSKINPEVKIKLENVLFEQPDAPWVALHVIEGDSIQAELSTNPIERAIGIVQIDIFIPEDDGTSIGQKLAWDAGKAFDRWEVRLTNEATSYFKTPERFNDLGTSNGFLHMAVRIPFRTDFKDLQ